MLRNSHHFCAMFLKYPIFLVLLFIGLQSSAQLLDNTKGVAFTDIPFFNTNFVKACKLKEIHGKFTFKKQGDIMRESDYVYVFNFDTLGNLARHYQTSKGDQITDTNVRFYDYTQDGRMVRKRISQKKGFLSTYYSYNSNGQIVKEEVYRDIDTLNSLLNPSIERSILWNTETMDYQLYEGQYKKKVFNSYGNQYLEVTKYLDSLGYLTREEELFTITRNRITTKYAYSDKGWIEKVSVYKNTDTVPMSESRFTYDTFGNLQSKLIYKDGVFITEYQIIYSGLTGLLYSIVMREVSTNFISIIRFSEPTFWDRPR
jgi:YD repeat-containing protein